MQGKLTKQVFGSDAHLRPLHVKSDSITLNMHLTRPFDNHLSGFVGIIPR